MLSALLHFLSVMSRSLFLVSLPVTPAARYGCLLPYLKSFFSYLPCQPVATKHDLLPFALPGSYKKTSGQTGLLHQFWNGHFILFFNHFQDRQLCPLNLLQALLMVYFQHLAIFAHTLSPIRLISALISLVSSAMIWRLIFR